MKSIGESGEVMGLYAQIDLCYYMLEEINSNNSKPRSGIDIMIDNATGYGEAQTKENMQLCIDYITQIIDCKKKIEADYSGDQEFLEQILSLSTVNEMDK